MQIQAPKSILTVSPTSPFSPFSQLQVPSPPVVANEPPKRPGGPGGPWRERHTQRTGEREKDSDSQILHVPDGLKLY